MDYSRIHQGSPGDHSAFAPNISILGERFYAKIAQAGVRFMYIANKLVEKYPRHSLWMLLYVTCRAGFGLAGTKEVGVLLGLEPNYGLLF